MLLGEFNHNIDEKGRLIIPAKLREDLGDSFVICNGLEGCLFVYSQEEWNKFVAELETLPRMSKDARIFKRYLLVPAKSYLFAYYQFSHEYHWLFVLKTGIFEQSSEYTMQGKINLLHTELELQRFVDW